MKNSLKQQENAHMLKMELIQNNKKYSENLHSDENTKKENLKNNQSNEQNMFLKMQIAEKQDKLKQEKEFRKRQSIINLN
jgi:hypothetical protein